QVAERAEHDAGRRFRSLHRPCVARRAGEGNDGLRDARAAGDAAMMRMWAIVERELRKFVRSPALMLVSMVLPLVQLIILGNAFGGKIRDAQMGVVDEDHGTQAVKLREAFAAVRSNIDTFRVVYYDNEQQAKDDVRTGKLQAAVIIPAEYSRKFYEQ